MTRLWKVPRHGKSIGILNLVRKIFLKVSLVDAVGGRIKHKLMKDELAGRVLHGTIRIVRKQLFIVL